MPCHTVDNLSTGLRRWSRLCIVIRYALFSVRHLSGNILGCTSMMSPCSEAVLKSRLDLLGWRWSRLVSMAQCAVSLVSPPLAGSRRVYIPTTIRVNGIILGLGSLAPLVTWQRMALHKSR